MKLYYSPGACSLAPHIALNEAGFTYELERVDIITKKTEKGADFFAVNAKGYVPTLVLDDGQVLTEVPVILQYLGDQKPASGLVPKAGTMERVRAQEWLNFITSELHKTYGPLFRPTTPEEFKKLSREYIARRLAILEKHLASRPYIMGDKFSAPDPYAFTVLRWSKFTGFDLSPFTAINAFMDRVAARPKVQEALKQEGLVKG
ncbi:MAG: glutathione transferase GstA [Alphaproteobacteria bacterium]|nr:glutathione transferase GstA [Alphaproteobacteria bacterium]